MKKTVHVGVWWPPMWDRDWLTWGDECLFLTVNVTPKILLYVNCLWTKLRRQWEMISGRAWNAKHLCLQISLLWPAAQHVAYSIYANCGHASVLRTYTAAGAVCVVQSRLAGSIFRHQISNRHNFLHGRWFCRENWANRVTFSFCDSSVSLITLPNPYIIVYDSLQLWSFPFKILESGSLIKRKWQLMTCDLAYLSHNSTSMNVCIWCTPSRLRNLPSFKGCICNIY